MEYVTLMGADDVRSAGNTMRGAADEMQRAASTISDALHQHRMAFEDTVRSFVNAVCMLAEVEGMKAENTHRERCGNSIAYGEDAFIAAAIRSGFKA